MYLPGALHFFPCPPFMPCHCLTLLRHSVTPFKVKQAVKCDTASSKSMSLQLSDHISTLYWNQRSVGCVCPCPISSVSPSSSLLPPPAVCLSPQRIRGRKEGGRSSQPGLLWPRARSSHHNCTLIWHSSPLETRKTHNQPPSTLLTPSTLHPSEAIPNNTCT